MYKIFIIIAMEWASQYAPGVMESVIATRQMPRKTAYTITQDLSQYDGFIAMNACRELGNKYYIRPQGATDWEFFLVVDCSGHATTSRWMRNNNIIMEVDHNTALRWNTIGRGIKVEIARQLTFSRNNLVD